MVRDLRTGTRAAIVATTRAIPSVNGITGDYRHNSYFLMFYFVTNCDMMKLKTKKHLNSRIRSPKLNACPRYSVVP